jgi:hypothetical protein
MDIDWYMIDEEGQVAHFASAGTYLPESVAASEEDGETLWQFFEGLKSYSAIVINEQNPHFYSNTVPDKKRYLSSFVAMAQKGLYSYNSDSCDNDPSITKYVKVVSPSHPLNIKDLPDRIASLLKQTCAKKINFKNQDFIDWRLVLEE